MREEGGEMLKVIYDPPRRGVLAPGPLCWDQDLASNKTLKCTGVPKDSSVFPGLVRHLIQISKHQNHLQHSPKHLFPLSLSLFFPPSLKQTREEKKGVLCIQSANSELLSLMLS